MQTKQTALSGGNVLLGTFFIEDIELAVDISKQKEIIRMTRLTKLPGQEGLLEGAINHRGVVLPVLNLRCRFEMPCRAHSPDNRIIIFDIQGTDIGVIVDAIGSMYSVPDSAMLPAPGVLNGAGGLVSAIFTVDSRTISILNTDMLLARPDDCSPGTEQGPQYVASGAYRQETAHGTQVPYNR